MPSFADPMAVQSFRVRKRKGICIIRIWGGLCLEWRSGDELVVTAVCGLSANQLLGSTVNHNLPALPFWMFPPGCLQWLHKNSLGILLDHLWTIYDNLILLDFVRKFKHWRQAMVLGWESSGYNYHDGWLDCLFLSRAYLSLVIFANSFVKWVKPSGLFAYTLAPSCIKRTANWSFIHFSGIIWQIRIVPVRQFSPP